MREAAEPFSIIVTTRVGGRPPKSRRLFTVRYRVVIVDFGFHRLAILAIYQALVSFFP